MDHVKRYQPPGRRTRLSHPDLHPTPEVPEAPSARLRVDVHADGSSSRSATISTRSSPGVQRGARYSQPNLPSLLSYTERRSADRRIRMSQPTLYHSSLSGLDGTRFSFSSLQEEGKPGEEVSTDTPQTTPKTRRFSKLDLYPRTSIIGKRERLSQPTLNTGDYYPKAHQRLSQPTLGYASSEYPVSLHSPLPNKKRLLSLTQPPYSPLPPKSPPLTKKERLSQLDFGGARYQQWKKLQAKFNRDRFSIPELETQNDLKLMAGTPKQRFSLDSQLNPKTGKSKSRLLPIASSPISEIQGSKLQESSRAVEGLQNVLITTTTPIFPPSDKNNPFRTHSISETDSPTIPIETRVPTKPRPSITPSILSSVTINRERLSVPEIRNSSLRRLLDPPLSKQRHSITGSTPRQCSLADKTAITDILEHPKSQETSPKTSPNKSEGTGKYIVEEPKHIQRHYAYTYETEKQCDSNSTNQCKVGKLPLPKKKYLESNFDENERVITTVIETEVPFLLTSPKYTKKTHAYSSEPPKWMRKYMGIGGNQENNEKKDGENEQNEKKLEDSNRCSKPKSRLLGVPTSPSKNRRKSTVSNIIKKNSSYIKLDAVKAHQENTEPCEVIVNVPSWGTGAICQVYELSRNDEINSDSDTDCSTSI